MNHSHLRAFHAVATQGSFTRAARALHVTQPTVSDQVKALETRYGVRLFERHSRRVELTDLGRILLEVTARQFDLEQEAERILLAARGLAYGRLRVGADSPYLVIPLLGAFKRRHPGVRLSVSLGNSTRVLEELHEARCEVAVLPSIGGDSRLHKVAFRRDRLLVLVPRGRAFERRRGLGLEELAAHPLVLREVGSNTRAVLEAALGAAGLEPVERLEIGSREGVREAVAAGLGLGVVSESEIGNDPRLRAVILRHPGLEIIEYAACLRERQGVREVRAFLDLVESSLESPV